MDPPDYEELLRPLVEGRRVILAGGPVAGFTPTAERLHRLGAEAILIAGTHGTGVGPLPDPAVASWAAVSPPAMSMLDTIHAMLRLVREPPPELREAIERFDPRGDALAIGSFLNDAADVLGRPFLAHRRPEWLALDDKTVVDGLWDAAGVPRAPSAVVALDRAATHRACVELDAGHGTVWAADSTRGWNGGAAGLRRVRCPAEADDAMAAFTGRTERVRVMPFLAGIPCSIHGIVFPDHVAALRPVEQITLLHRDTPTFFYAGCATFYDPPVAVTEAMRAAARHVGAHLRAAVDFRGAFTIDGIVGSDGFLPTELNPRSGAGLNTLASAQAELPLSLLLDALVGGHDLGYDSTDLERTLVDGADRARAGGTWRLLPRPVPTIDGRPVSGDAGGWRWSADGDSPSGVVQASPGGDGGFVRLQADGERTAVGPSFSRAAVAFWAFADRELGTEIGALEPADRG